MERNTVDHDITKTQHVKQKKHANSCDLKWKHSYYYKSTRVTTKEPLTWIGIIIFCNRIKKIL